MPLATSKDPPQGYITVQQALDKPVGEIVNIIGVVVDMMPPMKNRGTDMQLTFFVCDNSVSRDVRAALKVRWFWKPNMLANQPQVQDVGDVVVLQNVRILEFAMNKTATSTFSAGCIVFPERMIPAPHFNDEFASGAKRLPHRSTCRARAPTPDEQLYVITLHQTPQATGPPEITQTLTFNSATQYRPPLPPRPQNTVASAPALSSNKDKFGLLKDCKEMKFYDLAVEVVKIFPGQIDKCEVYVTDYTENPLLYDYGKEKDGVDGDPFNYRNGIQIKWQGPMGKRTMQVMLWEPHASACFRNINEHDFVFLRNVHVKRDRSGVKLEGALHQDFKYQHRVDIIKPRVFDDRMTELQKRRDEYWASVRTAEADEPKMNRKERKKMEKNLKRKQEQAEEQRKKEAKVNDNSDVKGISGHVVTERAVTTPTRLADILDNAHYSQKTPSGVAYRAPFINAKFRTQVRVVDFYPENLEDFAQSLDDPAYNDVPPDTQLSDQYPERREPRWEWAFYLMVEDAQQPPNSDTESAAAEEPPARTAILVADKDAEYLLDLSAVDLRADAHTLNQLREKLFVLWGNLQELKAEGLDPWDDATRKKHDCLPFECFVKQYGVEDKSEPLGYRRMFRLFGTNIK
ncbi:hypothetical protein IWX49DRAFT_190023 [Phyllosticta citricarpa]|uniref:Protection of telomeres protein 1 n=1 Tax=Phyllosticta paracitricarpa TaxID=2016321 RepID=A0ABR1NC86_9PEZI